MEDAHATILELDDKEKNAFFAVYDGHGGGSIAKYSGQHVHQRLAGDEAYNAKDYKTAFKKAFLGTDDDLRTDPAFYHDPSGCTAVAALLTTDGRIFCANAGDSRAVLSIKGEAKPLSYDHKPQNKTETARITAAGGYVEFNRVNGNLALSRAIGDFEFKQNYALPPEEQVVTVNPEIIVHDVTPEDEFLVIACDGIWDCMSSQDVVNWTRHQIAEKKSLEQICEDMMSRCLSPDSDVAGGIGCDNMTVLVVALLGGRTLDEWYTWVGERVENKVGYDTPRSYPSLYPPPRIGLGMGGGGYGGGLGNSSYGGGNEAPTFLSPSWLQRLNRPLYLSQAGISSILPVSGNSAGFDDSDDGFEDEDSDEEMGNAGGTSSTSSGTSATADSSLHAPPARDSTSSLRAQLEALDQRDRDVDEEMGSSDAGSDGQQHLEEDEDEEEVYNPLNPRAPKIIGAPLIDRKSVV